MHDDILKRIEKMKEKKLEGYVIRRLMLSNRHLSALRNEYNCETVYDVLMLCTRKTRFIKGFSQET